MNEPMRNVKQESPAYSYREGRQGDSYGGFSIWARLSFFGDFPLYFFRHFSNLPSF